MGLLLDVSDLVRESTVPAEADGCVFGSGPWRVGESCLRGDTLEVADVEVAFEPLQDDQPLDEFGPSSAWMTGCGRAEEPARRRDAAAVQPSTTPGPAEPRPCRPPPSPSRPGVRLQSGGLDDPRLRRDTDRGQGRGPDLHNFTVDALGVQIVVPPGGSGEVTLVDPAPGVYPFYCSCQATRKPAWWAPSGGVKGAREEARRPVGRRASSSPVPAVRAEG